MTVLTGFLGAGKTTLLNRLLRRPELAGTAVLVNEFGEIGLDHLLVETLDDDTVLLNAGCLCCTVRGDLARALRGLAPRVAAGEVRRVMIETTGLADPAPILHTLMGDAALAVRYRLDGVVTVVDAVNAAAQLDAQPEAVRQVAVADRLVLSKTDLADAGRGGGADRAAAPAEPGGAAADRRARRGRARRAAGLRPVRCGRQNRRRAGLAGRRGLRRRPRTHARHDSPPRREPPRRSASGRSA